MKTIVLASTSPYRRELLSRLRVPFETASPGVDEQARPGESPRDTAIRLAVAKAEVVAAQRPACIVIGSDQVAALEGIMLGKPGHRAAAIDQLKKMQGRAVVFYTALAVARRDSVTTRVDCIDTIVRFRSLNAESIEAYVDLDLPFDVAGAAKIESLGISLVEWVESPDPTALIGLPLIRLVSMLAEFGVSIPAASRPVP